MSTLSENETRELVLANHILYRHGVVDGFGHVSPRDSSDPNLFWLSGSMAPALVTAADILPFDMDANALVENPPAVYAERFIHSEIYRNHPEVMSVVHSHAPSIIPFGVVGDARLRAIFHMSSFLGQDTPIFEIRDHAGDASDLLIRTAALGDALATTLGENPVVLMRGHGATMVGDSIPQAVFRAIYAAENASLQSAAVQLGVDVNYLTEGEVLAATASNNTFIHRAWELWVRDVERDA